MEVFVELRQLGAKRDLAEVEGTAHAALLALLDVLEKGE